MMDGPRCPGSLRSSLAKPLERPCPKCGATVEIWSDEERADCRCGGVVFKNATPTCVEWCAAAERCLGHILDVAAIKAAAAERARAEGNPDFVREVGDFIREHCAHYQSKTSGSRNGA